MTTNIVGDARLRLRDRAPIRSLASTLRRAVVCLVCLSTLLPHTATAAAIDVLPNWDAGQHDTLTFRRRLVTRSDGKPVRDEDYRGRIELKVEATSPHGHYLRWTYRDVTKNDRPFDPTLQLSLFMSPDGANVELINVADVQRQVRSRLSRRPADGASSRYPGESSPEDLEAFARDAEQVEAFYLKDAQMFFMPFGLEADPAAHTELMESVPAFGPWGTLQASERWFLEQTPSQPDILGLSWRQAMVPVAAASVLREALSKEFPFLRDADGISTQGTFFLRRSNRWPLGVSVIRDSRLGTLRQVESWEFRSTRFRHLMYAMGESKEESGADAARPSDDAGEQLAAAIEAARQKPSASNDAIAMRGYLARWQEKLTRDSQALNRALRSCPQETPGEIVATMQIRTDGSLDGLDVTASPCPAATDALVQLARRAEPFAPPPLKPGVEVLHLTRRVRVGTETVVIE